jgi:hypothetical protein
VHSAVVEALRDLDTNHHDLQQHVQQQDERIRELERQRAK